MGRPRKKQKLSDSDDDPSQPVVDAHPQPSLQQKSPNTPDQAIRGKDRYAVPCPVVYSQYMKTHQLGPQASFPIEEGSWEPQNAQSNNNDSDATPPSDSPPTPYLSYPTSMEMWPDYSTMSQLPVMMADNQKAPSDTSASTSSASLESLNTLPSVPACPCLPNLYLTLSTLATISTFPVSNHTIESLQTASRTAHTVLYCAVCPQKFQSGMQNVMLLGTLLTVVADGWNRVRLAPAGELKNGFSTAQPSKNIPDLPLSPQESLSWRLFAYTMVRAHVFGDAISPTPFTLPDGTSSISSCPFNCPKGIPITLSYLVDAMARRQKTWHEMHDDTGEFPPRMPTSEFQHHIMHMNMTEKHDFDTEQDGHLCLKIVNGASLVVRGLDHPPPTCVDLGLKGHEHREECQICDSVVGNQFMAGNLAPKLGS
jgi:hypothetical protein